MVRSLLRTSKLHGLKWLMLAILAGTSPAQAAGTLDQIKSAGELRCGVVTEEYDYDKDDTHGNLSALGTDTCKAVAAAALGENGNLLVSSFPDEHHGLEALASGKIALLAGASPRASMSARYGVGFGQPFFFDGQGFIVAKTTRIESMGDLVGKRICFIGSTETETVLNATLRERAINFLPFPFEEQGEMEAALVAGHCTAMTGDISQLANARAAFHGRINDFVILPEIMTRHGSINISAPSLCETAVRPTDVVRIMLTPLQQSLPPSGRPAVYFNCPAEQALCARPYPCPGPYRAMI
jgi:general L-amino acid transport system substrate-binding protein